MACTILQNLLTKHEQQAKKNSALELAGKAARNLEDKLNSNVEFNLKKCVTAGDETPPGDAASDAKDATRKAGNDEKKAKEAAENACLKEFEKKTPALKGSIPKWDPKCLPYVPSCCVVVSLLPFVQLRTIYLLI